MNPAPGRLSWSLTAGALTVAAFLPGGAAAQQDGNVWFVYEGQAHEIRPDGSVAGIYSAACGGFCHWVTARDGNGDVFVGGTPWSLGGSQVNSLIHRFRGGAGWTGSFASGVILADLVTDHAGLVWTASASPTPPASNFWCELRRHGPGLSAPATILSFPGPCSLRLETHPSDGVWMIKGIEVFRISDAGSVLGSLVLPAPTVQIQDSACDPLGRIWILDTSGNLVRLTHLGGAAPPVPDLSLAVSAYATRIRVDGCGNIYVLRGGVSPSLLKYSPAGAPLPPVPLPTTFHAFDIDSRGNIWAQHSGSLGIALVQFWPDAAGISINQFSTMPPGLSGQHLNLGDVTGCTFAGVEDPDGDPDGDGTANALEFPLGTDPLSAASRPPLVTVAAIPGAAPPVLAISYRDFDPAAVVRSYVLGVAFSNASGIPLDPAGTCPTVPLDPDALLVASFLTGPPVFVGFAGQLAAGQAQAALHVPAGLPPGVVTVRFSGVTIEGPPPTITAIAGSVPFLVP